LRLLATPSCGGNWPRHCSFDPTGTLLFVSNQNSNNITTSHVDTQTGALAPASDFVAPIPVCVLPG
jgi:6-phosphogluconolactonase